MPRQRNVGIRGISVAVDREQLVKASSILKYTHESASAILSSFDQIRQSMRQSGATSTEEQDLLRAMLVMSAAGLDAILKQIIRDAIADLAKFDVKVIEGLEKFVVRKLKDDLDNNAGKRSREFMARILIAESMRDKILEEYIYDLTAGSLQSVAELTKVGNALGVTDVAVPSDLQDIFKIRNQIIHELDIDFNHRSRNRRPRSRPQMVHNANVILKVSEDILASINLKFVAATR